MVVEICGDILLAEFLNESDLVLGKLGGGDVVQVACLLVLQHGGLHGVADVTQLLAVGGDQLVNARLLLCGQLVGGLLRLVSFFSHEDQSCVGVVQNRAVLLTGDGLGHGREVDGSVLAQACQSVLKELEIDHGKIDVREAGAAECKGADLVQLLARG